MKFNIEKIKNTFLLILFLILMKNNETRTIMEYTNPRFRNLLDFVPY